VTRLARARVIDLNTRVDPRGALTAIEGALDIPFFIARLFYMYRVTPPFERGGHAHPDTEQFLIAVSGQLTIDLSDGSAEQTYVLDDPSRGLYVPPLVWTRLYDFTADAVCLAAASTHYDEATVIRDWGLYLQRLSALSSQLSGDEDASPAPDG